MDLFAGLGGFNLALTELGHRCVFACEKDEKLRVLYRANFGLTPAADIRTVRPAEVPAHDILCAGFPCQPFSKAGEQEGFACRTNGDLFGYVMGIVRHHEPKFIILENVANLHRHNDGATWASIERRLRYAGYDVSSESLSPHQFGVPQIRDRLFIVASKQPLDALKWPEPQLDERLSIESVLDKHPRDARPVSANVRKCLNAWQDFLDRLDGADLPKGPIWAMEFGATYPYEDGTPADSSTQALARCNGALGVPLAGMSRQQMIAHLPSYARTNAARFPDWKIRFIRQNREFYQANRERLGDWLNSIADLPPSQQKLEWNCRGESRNIFKYVIQFRASGVRVKRRTTSPSLIAMTTTQVPIIAWEGRYITPRECARLQSMDELKHLPASDGVAYAALGNAVNVRVVKLVAEALMSAVASRRTVAKTERHLSAVRYA